MMPVTWQTKFLEISTSALVGSFISSQNIWRTLPSFLYFKYSALAYVILLRLRNSLNSSSIMSVGTPFTARLYGWYFLVWKALGRLILTFLSGAALILFSFCNMITFCRVSPIITKSPFGSSLILEILRLG